MSRRSSTAITVIIPNFNHGRFLGDCLGSLVRQTRIPEGLIVIDDGSTDNSKSVVESFMASKGHEFRDRTFLPNRDNAGKLACINQAVPLLDTPYVLVLDSHDFLPEHAIETLLQRMLAARVDNPYVGFVYSDSHLVNEENVEIGRGRSTPWCPRLLKRQTYIPECALTLSIALKRAAPFDDSIRVGSKHHKWCKIADEGWIGHHVAEPLFCCRTHQSNLSGMGKSILDGNGVDPRTERLLSGYMSTDRSDTIPVRRRGIAGTSGAS